ncbi:MAG TPA: UDP-3-O-acyl-N-acetylglucosamine deacetylase [Devosia sp.]|nr:UDP-3-O-acyl-N-acetylglucosamine deacetylase [Devosia sp.]
MQKLSARQRTLAGSVEFSGIGVHSALPVTLTLEPAPADSGFLISRRMEDGSIAGPVAIHFSRIVRTTLCTTLDLGDSISVATIEHVTSALSGLGVDNAHLIVNGPECPILDGSAAPFVEGIMKTGLEIQNASRRYIKILRAVMVRNNEAHAALEPYNGRALDLEIDFDSRVIGRQRMIFDWTPRKYYDDVARARTFGFVRDAKILRQAGYALGSSLENSITVHEDKILNPGGLRYEDEFVRHKLLDAIGDLALGGLPIYGRFRSYRGGHALNALVLAGLFASDANYEIVSAEDLPLAFDALDDMPQGISVSPYLRSVG